MRLLAKFLLVSLLVVSAGNNLAVAQSVSRLSGIVVDQNGALLAGVELTILNSSGTLERTVTTNAEGYFDFPYLPSDEYSLKISKDGFDPSEIPSLTVTEANARQIKVELKVNPVSETIRIESEPTAVEQNRSGLTTLDRNLLENFPLTVRNYQSLINLVPGVVFTPVNNRNLGQFSSNGQRTNANYFTVDGVSANFGTTNYNFLGQTGSGSIPSMNIQGGLDNLVSTESVGEVKIQTLDFAPATAKMPGASVSFVSKSGGKDFSFSLFESYRNGALNARDYFDLEKPPHSFNDYGGTFSGPLYFSNPKRSSPNRTFFFLSFEKRQFTLPQPTVVMDVPSREIRENAPNQIAQAIYNSFPLPNGENPEPQTNLLTGTDTNDAPASPIAAFPISQPFRATYADPNNFENASLRIDHIYNSKISFFARFNYSPSSSENRNPSNLSAFINSNQITRTVTFGSTQALTSRLVNEFRFNLSRQFGNTVHDFDGRYGGVMPDQSLFVPTALEQDNTHYRFSLNGFPGSPGFYYGNYAENEMRQINFSDTLSYSLSDHEIKLGFDYRELAPTLQTSGYGIDYSFNSAEAISIATANRVSFYSNPSVDTKVLSISSFIQDNWQVNSRLNLVYGLRWEINPAPSAEEKDGLRTLETAPDLAQSNQTGLRLAPAGTPYYQTNYRNFAPRIGAAFQIFSRKDKQLILRGGAGTFYDLGQSQFNEIVSPLRHTNDFADNLSLPLIDFPFELTFNPGKSRRRLAVIAAARDYQSPRTYFWNLTAQMRLGSNLFSAAYVGGMGRDLQRTQTLNMLRPGEIGIGYFSQNFSKVVYIDNAYSSDYDAFQFQYSRSLAKGFNAFANYTWSHSIDNTSTDSNIATPFTNYPASEDRGNSDFDVRHVFNVGFSYDLPSIKSDGFLGKIFEDWTFGGVFFARTGLPFDVKIAEFNPTANDFDYRRANLVGGVPVFLPAADSPTGIRINPDAFVMPDDPFAQGNLGRNAFSGPSVWQFDSSIGRKFNLTGKLQLQLRLEVFNVFNRPNFSNPQSKILYEYGERQVPREFGVPTRTMARGYASAEPTGGVSPVFQLGGARAMQFSVRLRF